MYKVGADTENLEIMFEMFKEMGVPEADFIKCFKLIGTDSEFANRTFHKLLSFKEDNAVINRCREKLFNKTATTFGEVYELFHLLMCEKNENKECPGWFNFTVNIHIELTKSMFLSKDREEADKYFTYWGILIVFYSAWDIWEILISVAGWDIENEVAIKCHESGVDFDYKFHIKEGLDLTKFLELRMRKDKLIKEGKSVAFLDVGVSSGR